MHNRLRKRKNRRRAVEHIVRRLGDIQDFELAYFLSIPDTPANKERMEESSHIFGEIFDIIESLEQLKHSF